MARRKQKTSKGYLPHLRRNYNKGQVARAKGLLLHVLKTGYISRDEEDILSVAHDLLSDLLLEWPATLSEGDLR